MTPSVPRIGRVIEPSLYDRVGGMPYFERLVDRFYDGVASDPVLLAVYPDPSDLSGARHRLTLFLAQYWGGPTTYSDERGHPRLRARHFPFAIGTRERDRWLVAHARRDRRLGRVGRRARRAARLHDVGRGGDAEPVNRSVGSRNGGQAPVASGGTTRGHSTCTPRA